MIIVTCGQYDPMTKMRFQLQNKRLIHVHDHSVLISSRTVQSTQYTNSLHLTVITCHWAVLLTNGFVTFIIGKSTLFVHVG